MSFREKSILAGILVLCLIVLLPIGCLLYTSKIIETYGREAFTFRENSIVVTIPLHRIKKVGNKVGNKKGLNARRQRIITEMRDNPNITTSELHQILGISETAVENNLTFLKENGYVERVGSKKTGYWKVLE